MTGQGGGLVAAWYRGDWWLWFLRPIELLFRTAAAVRRGLYRNGFLKTFRAEKPVVVIGNITVGGTGKTPVVIALVEALQQSGIRPGVVSRGYGATGNIFPHKVTANSEATQCGDEPLLIYRRTGVPCVVSPDRAEAVSALLEQTEVDIVLSDDGLQHYALQRDLEIVLIDGQRGLGNGFCLPAGPLREPPSRLHSVDAVLYRNGTDPATSVSYRQDVWVNLHTGEQRPLQAFSNSEKLTAIAGIGQPEQFFSALQELGIKADTRTFPDHHHYCAADFTWTGGRPILMTEKDAVKCAPLTGSEAWYLRISAQLPGAVIDQVASLAGR